MKRVILMVSALLVLSTVAGANIPKNTATTIEFVVWDTSTWTPKTGDAANITAYVSIDGAGGGPWRTPRPRSTTRPMRPATIGSPWPRGKPTAVIWSSTPRA